MPYTLKQAAESVGESKTALLRAIQSGKISAKRGNHGQWLIDPAELHRVYTPTAGVGRASGGASETGVSESEIRLLHDMLTDQRTTIEGLENVISDLMARLDREADDRRRAYAQLTGLLTDQRQPAQGKKRWWPW